MKSYNPQHQAVKRFETLKSILMEGLDLNIDLNEVITKVESVIETVNSEVISIALIGSFSDGKTSTIAGLLGRLEDSMKIDTDESSDELKVYRPEGLKKGFEIIDTPGLFGSKEKEIDGKSVKFSEITERYLSQAHIILYLTGAVVPVKESHAEVLKHILRDLNKLDSTIFVINKMDEAGIDLSDSDDFNTGAQIKRKTLIQRLQQTIDLTEDETRRLNVVCISANPKGKGMEHWFANPELYQQRSHIEDLRNVIDKVVEHSNIVELQDSAVKASINDIVDTVTLAIDTGNQSYNHALISCKNLTAEVKADLENVKVDLNYSRNELIKNLESIRNRIRKSIQGASLDTIGDVINEHLGTTDGNVSFYILEGEIKLAISNCCDSNNISLESVDVQMEHKFNQQNEMLTDALKQGLGSLKNVKVTPQMVDTVRNALFKNYKFKPWGKINLAAKLTKYIGKALIGLNIGIEIYDWWKRYKDEKKLQELKEKLVNALEGYFKDLLENITNDEWYYTELAPSYNELRNILNNRETELENIKNELSKIDSFRQKLQNWTDIEDVEYEEL